jgi:phage host-nuclease inhibitor protein Gam
MTTRIKTVKETVSNEAMEAALADIRALTISKLAIQVERERLLKEIDGRLGPRLERVDGQIKEASGVVEDWAEANPGAFGDLKSLELTHGRIGWRTGQPKLKTAKGWTWERVLEGLTQCMSDMAGYVRHKEEVDKQQIIAEREVIGVDKLKLCGMEVVQEESFFIEPKVEAGVEGN